MKRYLFAIITIYLTLQMKAQSVSDVDGNTYNTVTIGTQIWMKENLKTTKYKDGSSIPNVTDNTNWSNLSTPAYCWYINNAAIFKAGRGGLYNWYTVNTNKLCPAGWHIPAIEEWGTLVTFLGGEAVAGPKMRETGNDYYVDNSDATNSSGLSLRATGTRFIDGSFTGSNFWGGWWSQTEGSDSATAKYINVDNNFLGLGDNSKKWGIGVRCLKDDVTAINTESVNEDTRIYPNPANDKLYFQNNKRLEFYVIIYDIQGKKVIDRQTGTNNLDISNLANGIYFVKIVDSGNIVIEKLIKK